MPTNHVIREDDEIGDRDWEGPIPGVTPARTARGAKHALGRRTASAFGSAVQWIETEVQTRPFAVLGAALGVGLIAGAAIRSATGRALLLTMARKLTKL
jgi:hypothetical protein